MLDKNIFFRFNFFGLHTKMTKRIIIADDERLVRESLASVVMRTLNDVEVVTVENGEELVDRVRNDGYDFIITDNGMSGMSGLSAIKEIRRFNNDTPIYMISGAGTNIELALFMGATGYISKRDYCDRLPAILNEYLGN